MACEVGDQDLHEKNLEIFFWLRCPVVLGRVHGWLPGECCSESGKVETGFRNLKFRAESKTGEKAREKEKNLA